MVLRRWVMPSALVRRSRIASRMRVRAISSLIAAPAVALAAVTGLGAAGYRAVEGRARDRCEPPAATRANDRRCRCLDPECFLIGSLRRIDVIVSTPVGSGRDHGLVPQKEHKRARDALGSQLRGAGPVRSTDRDRLRRGSARQISPGVGRGDETIEAMELTARIKQPTRHKPLDH